MTSLPSRTQVYEDRSFDNPGYGDSEDSIHGYSRPRRPPRKKSRGNSPTEDPPVVYIDLQDMTGNSSTVASPSQSEEPGTPDYVHNTIFYNPFDDKSKTPTPVPEASSSASTSQPIDPAPTNRLFQKRIDTAQPCCSPVHTTPNLSIREIPPQRYIPSADDGFNLTPIAVHEYPDLPPAYTEVERPRELPRLPVPDTVITIPPPPTQGFNAINNPTLVPANNDRKVMFCPRCGMRVHTLVVRQPGIGTHWIACVLLMFCLLPCIFCVYCTNWCKHKNHYCPNCNHMIGFEGLCHNKISVK